MIRKMIAGLIEWRKARLLRKNGFADEVAGMATKSDGWHELMHRAVAFDTSVIASRVLLVLVSVGTVYAWSTLPDFPNWPHAASLIGLLLILGVSELTVGSAAQGMSQALVGRAQVFERSVGLVACMGTAEARDYSLQELLRMYHSLWSMIDASMSARMMPEAIPEVDEVHELVTVLAHRAMTASRDEEHALAFRWLTHPHVDRRTSLWAKAITAELSVVPMEKTLANIREAVADNPHWDFQMDRGLSAMHDMQGTPRHGA